jgi:hypothetical protein
LIQSNQKSSQQKGFFAALGFCAAKLAKPRLESIALLRSLLPPASAKVPMPCRPQATIVLPAFARSCFA